MQLQDVKTALSSLDSPAERRLREQLEGELSGRSPAALSALAKNTGPGIAAEARALAAAHAIVGRPRVSEAPREHPLRAVPSTLRAADLAPRRA